MHKGRIIYTIDLKKKKECWNLSMYMKKSLEILLDIQKNISERVKIYSQLKSKIFQYF